MNYSSTQIGLKLELEEGIARDYIDAIRDAFDTAGMDMPKHLHDAVFEIGVQLDADEEETEGEVVSDEHGTVKVTGVVIDDGNELVDGINIHDEDGNLLCEVMGYSVSDVNSNNVDNIISSYE